MMLRKVFLGLACTISFAARADEIEDIFAANIGQREGRTSDGSSCELRVSRDDLGRLDISSLVMRKTAPGSARLSEHGRTYCGQSALCDWGWSVDYSASAIVHDSEGSSDRDEYSYDPSTLQILGFHWRAKVGEDQTDRASPAHIEYVNCVLR